MIETFQKKEAVKVEGNFIESFLVHFDKTTKKPINLTEIFKNKNSTLIIRHESRYFTAFDLDVLIAIFTFAKLHDYQQDFKITPSDIAKIMKISDSGENKTRIKNSIREIAGSPVYYNGNWYNISEQKYRSEGGFTFLQYHFVTREDKVNGKMSVKQIKDKSWIAISPIIAKSLAAGYFKYIDTEIYFSLPTGMARLAFLYLEKRLGKKMFYEENMTSFLFNILKREIKTKDVKNFKQRIIPALSEVYNFDTLKLKEGVFQVSHKKQVKQLEFFPKVRRPKLSAHAEYVLDRACQVCGREDDFFKNVVKKYVFKLGSDLVDSLVGECQAYTAENKSKYFIHLLKSGGNVDSAIGMNNPVGFLPGLFPTKEEISPEKQPKNETQQKWVEEEKRIQEEQQKEREEEERVNKIFFGLPLEEQERLKEEARQKIVAEHLEDGQEKTNKFFLKDSMVMRKVRELLKDNPVLV